MSTLEEKRNRYSRILESISDVKTQIALIGMVPQTIVSAAEILDAVVQKELKDLSNG